MNKKENRMAVRQTVEKTVIRDEQNRRMQFAATNPIKEVLKNLHTTLRGLDAGAVPVSRTKYGTNKVTHEKKKSLAKRLVSAFINPFTAILFCLVSHDMSSHSHIQHCHRVSSSTMPAVL